MGRKKVQQFSAPGSKTASIPLKNPEGVRVERKHGGVEGKPGARSDGKRAETEDAKWEEGRQEI